MRTLFEINRDIEKYLAQEAITTDGLLAYVRELQACAYRLWGEECNTQHKLWELQERIAKSKGDNTDA